MPKEVSNHLHIDSALRLLVITLIWVYSEKEAEGRKKYKTSTEQRKRTVGKFNAVARVLAGTEAVIAKRVTSLGRALNSTEIKAKEPSNQDHTLKRNSQETLF